MISFLRDLMRRSASFIFAEPSPILRASSMVGSSQNLASPSGWLTWMCLRLSSREKKKNRNSPSRKTVGDKQAPPLSTQHSLASPSEKGKSSCNRSDMFRPRAKRIRLSASFQRSRSEAGIDQSIGAHLCSRLLDLDVIHDLQASHQ